MAVRYAEYFPQFIKKGVQNELLDEKLLQFDLEAGRRAEGRPRPEVRLPRPADAVRPLLPARAQAAHRAAAGLLHARGHGPVAQRDRPRRARHRVLRSAVVSFDFMSSTPTLFNAGTLRSQLSSCYLTTVADDLDGIYEPSRKTRCCPSLPAAWATTGPRARPGLPHQGHQRRIARRRAVPEGGERHGRRRQPGRQAQGRRLRLPGNLAPGHRRVPGTAQEHRRRPPPHARHEHRQLDPRPVHAPRDGKGRWTLFSPSNVPDLHDKFGKDFEKAYVAYEAKASRGEIKPSKRAGHRHVAQDAVDAVRDRPPLDHLQGRLQRALAAAARRRGALVQPVHRDHAQHQRHRNRRLQPRLGQPRPAPEGRQGRPREAQEDHHHGDAHARQRDRHQLLRRQEGPRLQHAPPPRGPGHHGLPGRLYELRMPYASQEAVEFADKSMEAVCYHAYWASTELAKERGKYSSYKGSLWDKGILPLDTLDLLAEQRGGYVEVDRSATLDWDALRKKIARTACATPTAWPSPRPPPSPTSSAWTPRSSPASATSRSSPTCRASSPSSTTTWCAT
jgi:ribonucleoside-diphosphate reductase alpha chain